MKNSILVLLFCFSLKLNANTGLLWDLFKSAATESASAEKLMAITKNFDDRSPAILKGYRGMASFMMCNHVANPLTKITYFKEGKKWLEKALTDKPEDILLHFFRLSVQQKSPSLLGYKNKISEDKRLIFQNIAKIKKENRSDTMTTIAEFMLKNEVQLSEDEENILINLKE